MNSKSNKKNDDINVYELYINDMRKYGTINSTQALEYLKMYRNGTQKERKIAKERLVGSLQRFVLSIANKYARGNNIMDIIGEGNIGLMKAIENYNLESGVKFTTYATYWVRKEIMSYITIGEPMVTPPNAIKIATYVPKICKEFWHKNDRQPTTDEIQEILCNQYNLKFSYKEDLSSFQPMSIDEKYSNDEDGQEFMESNLYTAKTASCNTDNFAKNDDEKTIVNRILNSLNDRDAYIVKCLYGIGCEPKSMDTLANEVGIGYERIRQIAVNSLTTLGQKFDELKYSF